jgi:putative transposase
VAAHPDATLVELCELFAQKTGNWVGRTAMCSALQKLGLNRKKKTVRSSQAGTERVMKLRLAVLGKSQGYRAQKSSIFR